MPINTLIFDFDGTLVDSEMAHTLATKIFLKKLNLDEPTDDFTGRGLMDFLKAVKHNHPTLTYNFEELATVFEEVFLNIAKKHIKPYNKTIELARLAKKKGFKIAIASGTNLNLLKKLSAMFSIDTIFDDHIYSSEHDNSGKPSPDVFLRVAQTLNSHSREILILEDSYPGYQAAKKANMHLVMMPDSRYTSGYNFDEANLVFNTPNNLNIDEVFSYCINN